MKALIQYISIFFFLGIFFTSCFNPEDYVTPDDDIIRFRNGEDTIKITANGIDTAVIKAQISNEAALSRRRVTFKTNLGSFVGGKGDSIVVEADNAFKASASLTSVKTGTANVTAKIMGIKTQNTVKVAFAPAYPTKITVAVDSFAIANNFRSEVVITASLSAPEGAKPSEGYSVEFFLKDAGGNDIGAFLNNDNTSSTGTDGKAKIRYSAGEVDQEGYLTITATTKDINGNNISGTTRIFLSKQ